MNIPSLSSFKEISYLMYFTDTLVDKVETIQSYLFFLNIVKDF